MKQFIKREQKTNKVWNLQSMRKYCVNKNDVRILFLAMALCLAQLSSYAQTNPSNAKASESRTLTGTINPLNETQTYVVVYPEKLQYWSKSVIGSGYGKNISSHPQNMKAKYAKKGVTPDFTYTFITPGIGNIEKGTPVDYPGGGVVVEIRYTFPLIMQLTDRDGNSVKNFVLSDEENVMTATVHPQFLNDAATGQSPVIPVKTGFLSKDAAKVVDDKINDYLTRIEFNAFYEYTDKAKEVITNGYGYPKIKYAPVVLEVNKKEKSEYPELNSEIDKLITAVDEVFQSGLNDDVKSRLMELGKYFASNYTDSSSKDAIRLYAYNSSLAYLLGGDTDEAYKHFRMAPLGMASMPLITFSDLYPLATELHYLYLTKDDKEVAILPIYTVDDLKKMEKEALEMAKQQAKEQETEERMQALAARNVNDVTGYLVTKEGEKIEGKISMKFVELKSTQVLDMDIAKVAWVHTNGKSTAFKTKDVSYIVAGDRRFEPVTISSSTAIKVLGALSGNIGSDYFMEVFHKSGNCTAFYDPAIISSESYYVKCREEDKVESYSTILKGGKASEKFFENCCPELLERVKAKEFESSKEGLVSFTDALNGCAK